MRVLPEFFPGETEMARRMREFDWAGTPVGPVEGWPQSLRTALGILLGSGYPMYIAWGESFTQFYNDAYRPILGATKHPAALGQATPECFAEIWDFIGPMFRRVLAEGEATTLLDQLLPLDRNGYAEECYFTFSYSAIRDEAGGAGGVFVTVIETTERLLGERRLRTLQELAARTGGAREVADACALSAEVLAGNPHDLPFALIYMVSEDGTRARLRGIAGLPEGHSASPTEIVIGDDRGWPIAATIPKDGVIVDDFARRFGSLHAGPWPEPIDTAVVTPIVLPGQERPVGFLIAGVSPRHRIDEAYRKFHRSAAEQVAMAISRARAYEMERERAESLAELDRAKTLFFSNVSHELRTPLTLMLGPIEDILNKPEERVLPENRELASVAHRSGLQLLKLVNTLLDFSRLEAGRVETSYEPIELGSYTGELASVFRSAMNKAGLELSVDCPPLDEPAYVDREMWEKIVLNLLSNAFKFTFAGEISVALQKRGDRIELSVTDTGVGIPAAELPRVFERFHRVRGARSRTNEGTGIGLALVRELARLHGGDATVESTENRGSKFTVSVRTGTAHLPEGRIGKSRLVDSTATGASLFVEEALGWLPDRGGDAIEPEESPSLPTNERGTNGNGSRPRVLLADDNADMRSYVRRLLRGHYVVQAVEDGQAALEAALAERPDIIISDVMMPRLDGFELLRELRGSPETRDVPVLLLSARAGDEARLEGIAQGADDYLVKPFTARELLARVKTHLDMARIRREGNERLRLALTVGKLGNWELNLANFTLTSSVQCKANFGRKPEDPFPYETFLSAIHPEDVERVSAAVRGTIETGHEYRCEYRTVWPDGTVHWIDASGIVLRNALTKAGRMVGVTQEITEREENEARSQRAMADAIAAAEANAKFRTFFDQGTYFAGLLSTDGKLLEANTLAYSACGFTKADVTGKNFWECGWWRGSAKSIKAVKEGCREAANGNIYRSEIEYFLGDGGSRFVDVTIAPVKDETGRVLFLAPTGTDITERKLADAALRESEQHFRILFDQAVDGIFVTDAEGRYLDVNRAGCEMLGYTRAELLQITIFDLVIPEERSLVPAEVARLAEGGVARSHWHLRRKDGSFIIGELVARQLPDGRLQAIVRDITERKRAEKTLRDAQARLEASLTATEIATWTWDFVNNRIVPDKNLARMFSLSPESAAGGRIEEYLAAIHPEDREKVERAVRIAMESESGVYEVDYRLTRADGAIRWVTARGKVQKDAHGKPVEFPGAVLDVTAAKEAQEALRESEERFREMANNAPVMIWMTRPDGYCTFISESWCRFTGQAAGEAEGFGWVNAVHEDDRPRAHEAFVSANEWRAPFSVEYRLRRADGEYRWALDAATPRVDSHGEFLGYIGSVIDITDRKKAEGLEVGQKRVLELIAMNAPLREVFDAIILMMEEQSPTPMTASVLLLDADGVTLRHAAAPHLPHSYVQAIDGLKIGPSVGSCGTAAFRKQAVYVPDVRESPLWRDFAELAEEHHIRACWSTPIFSTANELVGTLAMYYPAPREPNPAELRLVEVATRTAAIAMERKRSEQELRRLASVIENSSDFIGVSDAHGNLLFTNRAAMELVGVDDPDQIRQSKIPDYFIPEQRHYVEETVLPTVAREGRWSGELTFRHFKTDAAIPVLYDLFRVDDPITGEPINFATVTRDITEQKRAQERLRESDARFRNLADHIPQLAWIADFGTEGQIHWFNRQWFDYTGTTLEEMRGSGWKSVLHPDYVERVARRFEQHVQQGLDWEDTFPLRGKDGRSRWFLSRMKVIRNDAGEVMQIFGTNTDITAQRDAADALAKAKEQTEAASRAKDDFLAALSHELRTPLTPVLMTASALEGDPALNPEIRDQLAMMRRNIELEARLIDDLLDLTRISRGKLAISPTTVDIHQLLQHTAEIVRSDELGKQVSVSFLCDAERHHVMADATRLQQVFWNLIKNALKFTPTGGSITVRTANADDRTITVHVIDTGIGIRAEALPHIFNAFEQGDMAGQHRYGGLGLGLTISKEIIRIHDGVLRAESEGEGRGATFTVELQTVDSPAPIMRALTDSRAIARKLHLLVVEDHEATRTVLTRLLKRSGHEVTAAGTIRDALAAFTAADYDAVISDLGLPDGSGLKLMSRLRRHRPIPGIALSGYGMEDDLRHTREAGFFAHLVKPVNVDQLRQLLDQLP